MTEFFSLPDIVQRNIIVQSSEETFDTLENMPEFDTLFNVWPYSESLYHDRSLLVFGEDILKYKTEEMSWKDFYKQMIKFTSDIKSIVNSDKEDFDKLEDLETYAEKIPDLSGHNNQLFDVVKLNLLESLKDKDWHISFTEILANGAVIKGNLPVLKWAYERDIIPDQRLIDVSAVNGHYDTIDWLIERGLPPSSKVYDRAATHNYIELLDWLEKHKIPINEKLLLGWRRYKPDAIKWFARRGINF